MKVLVEMPNVLLSNTNNGMLAQSSNPAGSFQIVDTANLRNDIDLIVPMLPVISDSKSLRAYRMKHSLDRPIVDKYVRVHWASVDSLLPSLKRKCLREGRRTLKNTHVIGGSSYSRLDL